MLNSFTVKLHIGTIICLVAYGIALNMIILSNTVIFSNTVTHYIGCDNKTTQECIKSITGGN